MRIEQDLEFVERQRGAARIEVGQPGEVVRLAGVRCVGKHVASKRLHGGGVGFGVVVDFAAQEIIHGHVVLHEPDQRGMGGGGFFGVCSDKRQIALTRLWNIAKQPRRLRRLE